MKFRLSYESRTVPGKWIIWGLLVLGCWVFDGRASAQDGSSILTLEQAEGIALKNHPQIAASTLRAQAAEKGVSEQRSALYPSLTGNFTGALVVDPGTAIAAGNLTTSSISDRLAGGGSLLQLITDFGRTNARVRSAQFTSKATSQDAQLTRAQVILDVRASYYGVLNSEAVLRAARDALRDRQLILHQVTVLAQNQLKSSLDVSFEEVLESEAELAAFRAESNVHESRAALAAAMGSTVDVVSPLSDNLSLPVLEPDTTVLIQQAEARRPDLQAAQSRVHAAQENAVAEKRLPYPTITALAAGGEIPEHDHTLKDNYAAAGFNVNFPILTGGLYAARRSEASLQAQAAEKDLQELQVKLARDVRQAWFEANDALRRIAVTERLVQQTGKALHLAQARYQNGLGSIVELNEGQLNQTSAQIEAASAKYGYLARRAALDYQLGLLP